jgi:hypothetical protein
MLGGLSKPLCQFRTRFDALECLCPCSRKLQVSGSNTVSTATEVIRTGKKNAWGAVIAATVRREIAGSVHTPFPGFC